MDEMLNLPTLNRPSGARSYSPVRDALIQVAVGLAIFFAAAFGSSLLASKGEARNAAAAHQAQVAQTIAEQGNRALKQIRREALASFGQQRPAPLSKIATSVQSVVSAAAVEVH